MAVPASKIENSDTIKEVEDDVEERKHFLRIINAFKYYRPYSLRRIVEAEKHYDSLSTAHQQMIPNYLDHICDVRLGIEHNYEVIKLIIKDVEHMFENKDICGEDEKDHVLSSDVCTDSDGCQNSDVEKENSDVEKENSDVEKENSDADKEKNEEVPRVELPLVSDMDKVKTTLKQFVRDWSDAGQHERDACYLPVIQEIEKRFPPDTCDPSLVQVLVPGAGLGRLAFELAKLGYSCQGNEWSLFMLFSSNFILNKCREVNSFTLYPWLHGWTNNMQNCDQVRPITFPDTNPSDLPEKANFSMAAGDFLEVYQEAEAWDCLATVFFIDTAHNIITYIETIYKILKPGGYWVNLGPLLYHYADMPNEMSIELSYEDVKSVIKQVGFVYEKEEVNIKSSYTQNPKSMLQYTYDSVFFVVKKPS